MSGALRVAGVAPRGVVGARSIKLHSHVHERHSPVGRFGRRRGSARRSHRGAGGTGHDLRRRHRRQRGPFTSRERPSTFLPRSTTRPIGTYAIGARDSMFGPVGRSASVDCARIGARCRAPTLARQRSKPDSALVRCCQFVAHSVDPNRRRCHLNQAQGPRAEFRIARIDMA